MKTDLNGVFRGAHKGDVLMIGSISNLSTFSYLSFQKEDKEKDKEVSNSSELTPLQKQNVEKLQAIDQKVREHEAAHIAAGAGVVTSGANFTYQKGDDGKMYAIGGEVGIDSKPEREPEPTIIKMQKVQVAALAPADPSSTDYQIASSAMLLEAKARMEVSNQKRDELLAQRAYKKESE